MINLPNQPKVVKKEGENEVVFEIEPLYPGYGVTVANSLRRVLLSSLEGAAATQVKIKGVSHEFSTIPGVLEDVIQLSLNLKQLRFRVFTDEPQKATLKVKGEKEIKGSDFDLSSQVELINKNCHIATLTSKSSEMEMEIRIEKGIGFSSAETKRKEKLEMGAIQLDAIFSPVRKVSFKVENMRVGERTDYDRVFLTLKTDGTIPPETALFQASEILENHFSSFVQSLQPKEKPQPKPVEKKERKKAAPKKKTTKVKHEETKKRKKT